jgi:hypothetical protein
VTVIAAHDSADHDSLDGRHEKQIQLERPFLPDRLTRFVVRCRVRENFAPERDDGRLVGLLVRSNVHAAFLSFSRASLAASRSRRSSARFSIHMA